MALRDGYHHIPAAQDSVRDGYLHQPDANSAITEGYDTILILSTPLALLEGENYRVLVNTEADIELPGATGGKKPYTYTLTGLPSGLSFDAATHTISGTHTARAAQADLTYTVTDAESTSVDVTYTIEVYVDPIEFPALRNYRGRINVAIPTDGIVLPEVESGGLPPFTYSIADLPAGVSFDASTRKLTGTPTAAGDNTVSYTATGSDTEDNTLTEELEFTVLAADAPLSRSDWDFHGYGLGTQTTHLLAVIESTLDVENTGNSDVWNRPPRSPTRGNLIDDDDEITTDLTTMRISGTASANVTRLRFQPANNRIAVINDGSFDIAGFFGDNPDAQGYLRIGATTHTFQFNNGINNVARIDSADDVADFMAMIEDETRFMFVIAEP